MTSEEYLRKAKKLIEEKGKLTPTEIYAELGSPPEGYRLKSDGRGSVSIETKTARAARRAKAETERKAAATTQTVGEDVYNKGVVTAKGSGLEEHHKRVVGLYKPFFEGLTPDETKELAQWFVDEGAPLGNVQENLEALTKQEHSAIHQWMKDNKMQVSNKKFPSFKDVPLNARFPAILTYLEQIQPAADEQLDLIKQSRLIDDLNLSAAQRNQLTQASSLEAKDALISRFKGMPTKTQLAMAGIASASFLGTGVSAAETAIRGKETAESFKAGKLAEGAMNLLQTTLAGASTVADFIPGVGEFVSTPADVANVVIDELRKPKPKQQKKSSGYVPMKDR